MAFGNRVGQGEMGGCVQWVETAWPCRGYYFRTACIAVADSAWSCVVTCPILLYNIVWAIDLMLSSPCRLLGNGKRCCTVCPDWLSSAEGGTSFSAACRYIWVVCRIRLWVCWCGCGRSVVNWVAVVLFSSGQAHNKQKWSCPARLLNFTFRVERASKSCNYLCQHKTWEIYSPQ